MLQINDKWVWDFWFAIDGEDIHMFYLQADKNLKDEALRHWNVSIGHAISKDYRNWTIVQDALAPSTYDGTGEEPFDSYTTWTGSIIKHDERWFMFYTGGKKSENGLIQRIGLATSDDLMIWEKYSTKALIEADPRWYELWDTDSRWHDQAWRDPWVFMHPETGQFHAFITARSKTGEIDERGVIGHAVSENLFDWDVLPPISNIRDFGVLEVPQVIAYNSKYYLFFSVYRDVVSQQYSRRMNGFRPTGTHYLVADDLLGPYQNDNDQFFFGDERGHLYSGKVLIDENANTQLMAFYNFDDDKNFIGEITDPIDIQVDHAEHWQISDSTT